MENQNNKKFNKENEKTKEAINKALNKLCETILQFERIKAYVR